MTRLMAPLRIRSTTFGDPSVTFCTLSTGIPIRRSARAVPAVATSSKPSDWSSAASIVAAGLSRVANRQEDAARRSGSGRPAARSAFAKAVGKSGPMPITSPVERISGPSVGSAPENRWNGSTAAFTLTWSGVDLVQLDGQPERGPAGRLDQVDAGRLGDERHRARRPRVGLDHVDLGALHGELHVDQPAHAQRLGDRRASAPGSRARAPRPATASGSRRPSRRSGRRPPRRAA